MQNESFPSSLFQEDSDFETESLQSLRGEERDAENELWYDNNDDNTILVCSEFGFSSDADSELSIDDVIELSEEEEELSSDGCLEDSFDGETERLNQHGGGG